MAGQLLMDWLAHEVELSEEEVMVAVQQDLDSVTVIRLRAREEFSGWVDGLAVHDRRTMAGLMERALIEYAKKVRYPHPAPSRLSGRNKG